jgi:hypothetical protein
VASITEKPINKARIEVSKAHQGVREIENKVKIS